MDITVGVHAGAPRLEGNLIRRIFRGLGLTKYDVWALDLHGAEPRAGVLRLAACPNAVQPDQQTDGDADHISGQPANIFRAAEWCPCC